MISKRPVSSCLRHTTGARDPNSRAHCDGAVCISASAEHGGFNAQSRRRRTAPCVLDLSVRGRARRGWIRRFLDYGFSLPEDRDGVSILDTGVLFGLHGWERSWPAFIRALLRSNWNESPSALNADFGIVCPVGLLGWLPDGAARLGDLGPRNGASTNRLFRRLSRRSYLRNAVHPRTVSSLPPTVCFGAWEAR